MIDYEEALLRVSDALRRHNKPAEGISSREACEDIIEAVRPKGKWKKLTHNARPYRKCSNCEDELLDDFSTRWDY